MTEQGEWALNAPPLEMFLYTHALARRNLENSRFYAVLGDVVDLLNACADCFASLDPLEVGRRRSFMSVPDSTSAHFKQ